MTLEVQFLPAREGDAIWLRWTGEAGDPHQALVDLGTEQTGRKFASRLRSLPEDRREFDLLVVTHVDRDHIGGVLTCISDPLEPVPGLRFHDIWFNAWAHLHGQALPEPQAQQKLEAMGPAQGERLTVWLAEQAWNKAFGRGPVVRPDNAVPYRELPGGLRLTVLGPTQARLADLIQTWDDEVTDALAKGTLVSAAPGLGLPGTLESYGSLTPPVLESRIDVEDLAASNVAPDRKQANGTSIILLVEWRGRRVLLTGDAFTVDVLSGLDAYGASSAAGRPHRFDLVKLPHHGSAKNFTTELAAAVATPVWVFSTDGTTHHHPDATAIARVLVGAHQANPVLAFNVPSTFSGWWDNDDWRKLVPYTVVYGDPEDGLTFTFEPLT